MQSNDQHGIMRQAFVANHHLCPNGCLALHWVDYDCGVHCMNLSPFPTIPIPPFNEKLDQIFDLVRKPDGSRYTNPEIARRAGLTDGKYVWKLRRGYKRQNPLYDTIIALARAFDVSPGYFFEPEEEDIKEELT